MTYTSTPDTSNRVLRFVIPADDQPHTIPAGPVLMVTASRNATSIPAGKVEVWVEATLRQGWPNEPEVGTQEVQIFGTGQPLPADASSLGSCLDSAFVWHLYRLAAA